MLLDRGVLRKTSEGIELTGDVPAGDLDVPETLQALIGARLDELPAEERSVLQHASILGKTFPVQALAAVMGRTEEAVVPALESLRERELLTLVEDPVSPDVGQYGFLQSIVQRVVYDTISRRDRKVRHLAVARHLEETWAGDADDIAEVVASHYVDAYEAEPNDPDATEIKRSAALALERAGKRALALASAPEAAAYFDRAAALTDEEIPALRLRERAASAVWIGGDGEEVIRRLDPIIEAYDRLELPLDSARARATLGDALWGSDRLDEALDRLRTGYDSLADLSTPEVAALAAQLGRITYFHATGEAGVREAMGPIDHALRIAEAERLGDVLSDAMNTKSLIMDSLHRPEECTGLLKHALTVALEYDAVQAALRAYTNLSNLMWSRDRYAEARAFEERGRELAQRTGYRGAWWFLGGHVSQILYLTGAWDELEDLWRESDPHRDEPGVEFGLIGIDYDWGLVCGLARGDVDEFARLMEPMRKYEHGGDFQGRNFANLMLSQLALLRGDPTEAVERSERILNARDVLGPAHWEFKAGVEVALQAALATDDLQRAETVLARARATSPGELTPNLEGTVAAYGARIEARRGGDPSLIEEGFRRAEQIFLEIGDPFRRGQHLLAHAEWLATTDRSGEALVIAGDAAEIFRTLRATPWIERAEKLAPVVAVSS